MRVSKIATVSLLALATACASVVPLAVESRVTQGVPLSQSSAAIERPLTHHRASPSRANPDPVKQAGMLIEISIRAQRLIAWRNGIVVMRAVISTGRPGYETPPGRYHVIMKNPMAWSSKWDVWMPWAMNFYGNYFIHQLPHSPGSMINIGASQLGTAASHGCVRVGIPDAERLFRLTPVGTPVWIH